MNILDPMSDFTHLLFPENARFTPLPGKEISVEEVQARLAEAAPELRAFEAFLRAWPAATPEAAGLKMRGNMAIAARLGVIRVSVPS